MNNEDAMSIDEICTLIEEQASIKYKNASYINKKAKHHHASGEIIKAKGLYRIARAHQKAGDDLMKVGDLLFDHTSDEYKDNYIPF